ncbi:MAG TPA: hypothetical protein VFS21_30390 [Roseiflexaceae bacterium]|nr:hypothetical protein [Roseiflexaceae bacterium]
MSDLKEWLIERGPTVAQVLAADGDSICAAVSARLERAFPDLCNDPARPDREAFRRTTVVRSPQRLHALVRLALMSHSLAVFEREYRWLWGVVRRYGVEQRHLLGMAGWYFNAARDLPALANDRRGLLTLKRAVTAVIRETTGPNA